MRKPSDEFKVRLAAAREWRQGVESDIKEVYRFCAPGRDKEFNTGKPSPTNPESEVYVSIGEEMATDLAGDLVSYFCPPEALWYEIVATIAQDDPMEDEILDALVAREGDVADLITKSNFNDLAPQIMLEAAAHGTAAVWVEAAHLQQPLFFETVPPAELLITPGHLGLLDRFREKRVQSETLPALFASQGGRVSLSDERLKAKIAKPQAWSDVVWGFWANWKDPARPTWNMQITVDGNAVSDVIDLGDLAGSCPLLVGRFNPQPNRPWGRGPGIKALLDLRTLNMVEGRYLAVIDDATLNTFIYRDDSTLDLSDGLESGRSYPAGSRFDARQDIFMVPKIGKIDQNWAVKQDYEQRIRTGFYQDGPRQRGDTPPTAAQWYDERRRVQQRLGKPSAPLWSELIMPMLQRIEFLGIRSKSLSPEIRVDGNVINAVPISPLQKAQNHDQVMIARSTVEFAAMTNPEGPSAAIDTTATLRNIVKASGDKLTVIRKEEKPLAPTPSLPA